MKSDIEASVAERNHKTIHGLVDQIKAKEELIAQVQDEITDAESQQTTAISDADLLELKNSVQAKVRQYKILLNEKFSLFEEMYSNALILVNRDKQIIINQVEIVQLKHEIDINILEIEQKTAIIAEL